MDYENAIIRQRRHSKSQQIAINVSDGGALPPPASTAAAALQPHEAEAESQLLQGRRYQEPVRLQRLQIQYGAIMESSQ